MAIANLAQTTPVGNHRRGPSCTVCAALEELSPDDAAGLIQLLSDKRRRYTEVADLIAADQDTPEWVRNIHHSTYARHATGGCAARTKLRS